MAQVAASHVRSLAVAPRSGMRTQSGGIQRLPERLCLLRASPSVDARRLCFGSGAQCSTVGQSESQGRRGAAVGVELERDRRTGHDVVYVESHKKR